MGHLRPFPFLLLALFLTAPAALAQSILHTGVDADGRMEQTVELVDAWRDERPHDFYSGEPRDVLVRVEKRGPRSETVAAHLVLFGPWGAYHLVLQETSLPRAGDVHATGKRTTWHPVDVDADGRNELVIVERVARTHRPLDENGDRIPGAGPLFEALEVSARYLDREGSDLVEVALPADPEDSRFALMLEEELGGHVTAGLQLAAGDVLFNRDDFAEARYLYQVVRQWAERAHPSQSTERLAVDAKLRTADPDQAEFAWIAATLRYRALPPFFRRHR